MCSLPVPASGGRRHYLWPHWGHLAYLSSPQCLGPGHCSILLVLPNPLSSHRSHLSSMVCPALPVPWTTMLAGTLALLTSCLTSYSKPMFFWIESAPEKHFTSYPDYLIFFTFFCALIYSPFPPTWINIGKVLRTLPGTCMNICYTNKNKYEIQIKMVT